MSLIFSPLTEDVLESPFEPIPRGAFVMLQLGDGTSKLESDMDEAVCAVLSQKKFKTIKATTERGHKDYLEKIIQLIRGCGYGIAIFSEYTPAPTLANIFFEIALCNLLGKPVIIVKSAGASAPSDFVRTEWVSYTDGSNTQLKNDIKKSIDSIVKLASYYEKLGDIAMEAGDIDFELAFERFKQATLITNKRSTVNKISKLLRQLNSSDDCAEYIKAARARFQKSVIQFTKLYPER